MTKKENIHNVEVVNVEQLGNETMIAFEVGSELWTAKWTGQWNIQYSQRIPIQILPEYLLFFDAESGKLIQSAQEGKRQEVVSV